MYHMLVLTTIVNRSTPHQAAGRVLFFNLKTSDEGTVDVKLKRQVKHEKPVYSVAAFGPRCVRQFVAHLNPSSATNMR